MSVCDIGYDTKHHPDLTTNFITGALRMITLQFIRCCHLSYVEMKCSVSNAYTQRTVTSGVTLLDGMGFTQFYLPPTRLSTNGVSHPAFIQMMVVALVHSRLDYGNGVLVGLPDAPTPVSPQCSCATDFPSEIAVMAYKVLHGRSPSYSLSRRNRPSTRMKSSRPEKTLPIVTTTEFYPPVGETECMEADKDCHWDRTASVGMDDVQKHRRRRATRPSNRLRPHTLDKFWSDQDLLYKADLHGIVNLSTLV